MKPLATKRPRLRRDEEPRPVQVNGTGVGGNQELSAPERLISRSLGYDIVGLVVAAGIALGVAIQSLQLWHWKPGTPLELGGDSTFVSMELKTLQERGWFGENPSLGYPLGMNGWVFPELNFLHMALIKAIEWFVSDPFTSGVIYFVAGFPLAAATMYALCRMQAVRILPAVAVAVLFANAPGHQQQYGHLWLASYWVLPGGVWVALELMRTSGEIAGRGPRFGPRNARWLMAVALIFVGLSGVYYVAFIGLLLVVATVARRMTGGQSRDWFPGLQAILLLLATASVPLLLARLGARKSELTGVPPTSRSFTESETFAGKFMDLVLPWSGHRLSSLSSITNVYNSGPNPTVETSALGIAALAGVLWLLTVIFGTLVDEKRQRPIAPRRWAMLLTAGLAFFTVGGLGSFVALFLTAQVRTWSRMSTLITLFGLLAVGHLLSRLQVRKSTLLAGVMSGAVLVVGVLDQTNPDQAPDYRAVGARFAGIQTYVTKLQAATHPGCAIFQLPVTAFPESGGYERMNGYDQIIPFLANGGLSWSSGAMRGTSAADWQTAVDLQHPRELVKELASAGFCAIEVNSDGFDPSHDPRNALRRVLGAPASVSSDGVLTAYALPSSHDPASASFLLRPVLVSLDAYPIERGSALVSQWTWREATVRVVNLGGSRVPVDIAMRAEGIGDEDREMVLRSPSGTPLVRTVLKPGVASVVSAHVEVPPGVTRWQVQVTGEPVRLDDRRISASAKISNMTALGPGSIRVVTVQEQVRLGVFVP